MERGITLIALAITIIVLLLLSGVTIATLTGENGILNKANTAKTETTKQGAKEKVQVQVMGSYDLEGNAYEHIAEKILITLLIHLIVEVEVILVTLKLLTIYTITEKGMVTFLSA